MNTELQTLYWDTIQSNNITISKNESLQQVIVLDKTIEETTLTFLLEGIRASLDCVILILADEISVPLNISVIAQAPHTSASVRVRSVGRNRARVVVNGMLQCVEGAGEGTMHFSHHALHLSADAQTKTIPSLEIKADDVQAKHEVSVGYFDPQAVWYGQTRGIEKDMVIGEMAKGFVVKDLETLSPDARIDSIKESITGFMTSV